MNIANVDKECGTVAVVEIHESLRQIDEVVLDMLNWVNQDPAMSRGFSIAYREESSRRFMILSQRPIDDFDQYMKLYVAQHPRP